MIERVLVVGAGPVGLPLALHLGHVGWPVGVVDRPPRIARLRAGEPGFHEPGVRERLRAARGEHQLSFHDTLPTVDDTCAVFICVGDGQPRGRISDEPIMNLLAEPERFNDVRCCVPFVSVEGLLGGLQSTDLASGLEWADHLVFAVPHRQFLEACAFLPVARLTDLTGVIAPPWQRVEAPA